MVGTLFQHIWGLKLKGMLNSGEKEGMGKIYFIRGEGWGQIEEVEGIGETKPLPHNNIM